MNKSISKKLILWAASVAFIALAAGCEAGEEEEFEEEDRLGIVPQIEQIVVIEAIH